MPYINLNGQLVQVTQEQFDIYTVGQNINASTAAVQTSAANIAAGGTVTQSNTATATILTPNTTNTSPGQVLTQVAQPTNRISSVSEILYDELGNPINVVDPLKDELMAIAKTQLENPKAFIENERLFGNLAAETRFTEPYLKVLASLHQDGAQKTLVDLLS